MESVGRNDVYIVSNTSDSSEDTGKGNFSESYSGKDLEALPQTTLDADLENSTEQVISREDVKELSVELESLKATSDDTNIQHAKEQNLNSQLNESPFESNQDSQEDIAEEKEADPVFDGIEAPELDGKETNQPFAWPEKAVALSNFVKVKGAVAVSTVMRRLSGQKDEDEDNSLGEEDADDNSVEDLKEQNESMTDSKLKEILTKAGERLAWNPLNYIKSGRDLDADNNEDKVEEPTMKGRILVYTRLGCQECKEVRSFLRQKQLRFVEINIDIYPTRKLELEKNTGSSAVPRVYLNDILVGGLNELKDINESGKLENMINDLINQEPPATSPLPPLPGEDDKSGSGKIDELAAVVRKMKESLTLKDRFYKMRKFNNCFVGSEAVDFLAEDQYLERLEAAEFGRKLANNHFFKHVLEENIFEDGNHFYRFLEHDPIVISQCYNIPRGVLDVKPKPITEIASRLRLLSFAIFEAYVSEDGKHVDYGNIKGSEEYKRYLRTVEELQRVNLDNLSREEKLAFFINLYNMMSIHAILAGGYPVGPLERRKFFGDFKYVIGGSTYSLTAIQNGILRGNQRPPYNLVKPFGPKDRRFKVTLPYSEPLVHFALSSGTRSGPMLRCYSPGNIDKELVEAARDFLRGGGLVVNAETKTISASKILQWYSVDFGKNEVDVIKHAANYLEPEKSEELLELLASTQLKVTYQPYDWSINC